MGLALPTFVLVFTCTSLACGGAERDHEPTLTLPDGGTAEPVYDQWTGWLEEIVYKPDRDGPLTARAFMNGPIVLRVEIDETGDGIVDRWEYFAKPAAGPGRTAGNPLPADGPPWDRSRLERVEMAKRGDGIVSRREFFEQGVLVRVEEDTSGDGQVDKWETYTAGALTLMELDTAGRGTPNRRLVYRTGGVLDRIEADTNGDGTFDRITPASDR